MLFGKSQIRQINVLDQVNRPTSQFPKSSCPATARIYFNSRSTLLISIFQTSSDGISLALGEKTLYTLFYDLSLKESEDN
jgi:hypothetical protein